MDQLIRESLHGVEVGGAFTFWHLIASLLLSFFLTLLLAYVYRITHRGLSYSVTFVHTMVIMGVTISVIMLIIGSNIARAFALVGALSIIRFRNAVKESRDVAFVFVAMAIGMATGTGFYWAAVVFTLFVLPMIYAMHRFDVGAVTNQETVLRVEVPSTVDHSKAFDALFYRDLESHDLVSIEGSPDGAIVEVVYSVQFKRGVDRPKFADELRTLCDGGRVTILTGRDLAMV